MTENISTHSQSILQTIERFSEEMLTIAPKIQPLFEMLDLDIKVEFYRAFKAGDVDKLRSILHLEKQA